MRHGREFRDFQDYDDFRDLDIDPESPGKPSYIKIMLFFLALVAISSCMGYLFIQ